MVNFFLDIPFQRCYDRRKWREVSEMSEVLKFVKEKETKNTVRFGEVAEPGKPPIVGTLYVQKWFVGEGTRLVVTVDKDEDYR